MHPRGYALAGAATVVLTAASLAALAAAGPTGPGPVPASGVYRAGTAAAGCPLPSLPGQRVTVTLADMGGGSMMGGRMMLHAVPQAVRAGTVSFIAVNSGSRRHELVALPLAAGAAPGQRAVGADDTVDESGSLGEALADCRAGGGEGITAGGAGWVTVTLKPGRYELICNLPGHYAAGMFTELDVG